MRLTVRKFPSLLLLLALVNTCALAQCKCTCRPSPPGGTTQCESGAIAICGDAGDGTCHGRCIVPPGPDRSPFDYELSFSAFLLGNIFHRNISTMELTDNPATFEQILTQLIKSSATDEPTKLAYKDRQVTVSIGMSDDAKNLLKSAQKQLKQ